MKATLFKMTSIIAAVLMATSAVAADEREPAVGKPRVGIPLEVAVTDQGGGQYKVVLIGKVDRAMDDIEVTAVGHKGVSMLPATGNIENPVVGEALEVQAFPGLTGGATEGYVHVRLKALISGEAHVRNEVVRVGANPTRSYGMQPTSSLATAPAPMAVSLKTRPSRLMGE